MVSDNKPDQDDQGSFKDYKNVSINQIIRKSQDSKLTLPPLGVKSDSQQQQLQQQSQLSPPQPQQQADYTYSTFQAQSYDPYRQMTLPQQQSQQQQQQQQQPTYASPSQYPIPQQSFPLQLSRNFNLRLIPLILSMINNKYKCKCSSHCKPNNNNNNNNSSRHLFNNRMLLCHKHKFHNTQYWPTINVVEDLEDVTIKL